MLQTQHAAGMTPQTMTTKLSRREREIMNALFALGERASAEDIRLQLTEPPSNRPGDGTEIVENMVLTIEPGMEYAPGKMIVHEENIAVTKEGPRLLTRRAPRELPVIG